MAIKKVKFTLEDIETPKGRQVSSQITEVLNLEKEMIKKAYEDKRSFTKIADALNKAYASQMKVEISQTIGKSKGNTQNKIPIIRDTHIKNLLGIKPKQKKED